MISASFEQTIPVRYHQLDFHGRLKPTMLLNYLQDVAGLHARRLGISVVDLRKNGFTWVLSRIHLVLNSSPRADESLRIVTWPSTREGLFSCREFQIFDQQGRELGCATTSWAVLSLKTRRPVKLESALPAYPLCQDRAIYDQFESLPSFPQDLWHNKISFKVLRSDLDSNQHVNNTVFVGWALESVPDSIADGMLCELEISYRAEALYGDEVMAQCVVVEPTLCLHRIINCADGRELARVRTRWKFDGGKTV